MDLIKELDALIDSAKKFERQTELYPLCEPRAAVTEELYVNLLNDSSEEEVSVSESPFDLKELNDDFEKDKVKENAVPAEQTKYCTIMIGGKVVYECKKCLKTFVRYKKLSAHLKTYEGIGFTCGVCGKVCTEAQYLRNHQATHFRKKKLQKKKKGTKGKKTNKIKIRRRDEKDDKDKEGTSKTRKSIKSNVTSKQNKTAKWGDLNKSQSEPTQQPKPKTPPPKQERKTQTTKSNSSSRKPQLRTQFKCSLCPKSFMTRNDLLNHVQDHLEKEKPYQCTECNKRFGSFVNLSRHQQMHSEVDCELCGEKVANAFVMINHKRNCLRMLEKRISS